MSEEKININKKQLETLNEYLENLRVSGSSHFIDISNIGLFKHLENSNPHLCSDSIYLKYTSSTIKFDGADINTHFIEITDQGIVNSVGDTIITQEFSNDKTLKNITLKTIIKNNDLIQVELYKNTLKLV